MKALIILILFTGGSFSFSSNSTKRSTYKKIESIFQLPVRNRIAILKSQPHFYFHHLQTMFYLKNTSDEIKWKTLMAMARLNPEKTKPHIQYTAEKGNWFLKNAALISMEMIDPDQAILWAAKFLDHSSLILRTASVDLIRRQKAIEYKNILWQQLGAKQNFRNGKSLWIRYNILQTLSEFSQVVDAPRFKNLLKEKDPRVIATAQKTLSHLVPYESHQSVNQPMTGQAPVNSIEL